MNNEDWHSLPSVLSSSFLLLWTLALAFVLLSCATNRGRNDPPGKKPVAAPATAAVAVPDEVSLKADRSELAELRKGVPSEVRRENDELAFILGLMAKGDEEPGKVRERFNTAVRKRREKTDQDLRKRREEFTRGERKSREDFLKNAREERARFVKTKVDSEGRNRFFGEQDRKRKEFFAGEQDRRKEFESDMSERRKTFEDYIRERTNHFNQEYRAYTTAFYERKSAEALKKRTESKAARSGTRGDSGPGLASGSASAVGQGGEGTLPLGGAMDGLEDFRNIPAIPATPLGPADHE